MENKPQGPPIGFVPQSNPQMYSQAPPSYEEANQPNYPQMPQSQPYQPQPQQQPKIYTNNLQQQRVYAVNTVRVGPEPCSVTCPSCHLNIVTKLDYETSSRTHIIAAILCLFICWPCAWVPYVIDSCKNANHYCPNCGCYIGTYHN